MTVTPGFGGQKFMIDETMPKVKEAKEIREQHNLSFHIQVDGGICSRTAKISASYGANIMVAGTGTFRAPNASRAFPFYLTASDDFVPERPLMQQIENDQ